MKKPVRMTRQAQKVLFLLLRSPRDELSGVEIAEETELASGSLYPLLYRLEGARLLLARWEEQNPSDLGRPRRRYYRLTPEGVALARKELKQIASLAGVLAWNS